MISLKSSAKDKARTPDAECECETSDAPHYTLSELLKTGRRVVIEHEDRRYLLTLTRRRRLILTLEPAARDQKR